MNATINGATWLIRYVNHLGKVDKRGRHVVGDCDYSSNTIRIRRRLDEKEELYVVIHEVMHALESCKTEEWVEQASAELHEILWRLGWRKQN